MKELEQIPRLWASAEQAGASGVLATVVRTQGSSYRSPGARLLITSDGRRAGSVSGGCLEDDLVKKAWWLTERGAVIRRYDTTADGEIANGGYGLGCNGTIDVLLERIGPGDAQSIELIRQVRAHRFVAGIAYLIEPRDKAGQKLVIRDAGNVSHNIVDAGFAAALQEHTIAAIEDGGSRHVWLDGAGAFIETLIPPLRLLIFGAGEDAIPLTEVARFLGWETVVSDGRAHYAVREKFPCADRVALRKPGDAAALVDPWTAAVIMNHSFSQDLQVLQELRTASLRYLGILGPRKRTEQILNDAGFHQDDIVSSFHSPIGLDIGAEAPEQVALAVAAEIQAVLHARDGGPLCRMAGPIHAREASTADNRPWIHSIACA